MHVFENNEKKTGRRIPLRVVVLPATAADKKPDPLVLLAGGPGQAASKAFADALPAWRNIAAERDLVMVDVRGSGESAPLNCRLPNSLEKQLTIDLDDIARDCSRALRKQHALSHYTTAAIVSDLEEVRQSLGYRQLNLLGVSYGSRLALHYAAQYPHAIRSMILDAVAPPELHMPGPFAADAETALKNIFAACSNEAACKAAFGDLNQLLQRALQKLEKKPRLTLRHPRSGEPLQLTLSPKFLLQSLRSLAYSPELVALIPYTIFQAEKLQFQGLIGQLETLLSKSLGSMSHGLLLSVTCAEDVHRIDSNDERKAEASIMGRHLIDEFRSACKHWKVEPQLSSLPKQIKTRTLLLSGGLDPVTPPRWANRAAKRLSQSIHVIMPEAAHGISTRGCVPALIEEFLEQKELNGHCAKKFRRPAFFTSYSGPQP
jgi:pimeloyl-ACP methyl ester carboxylesterase